jgi:hypothetical protein
VSSCSSTLRANVNTSRVAWSIVARFLVPFAAAPPRADHTPSLHVRERA